MLSSDNRFSKLLLTLLLLTFFGVSVFFDPVLQYTNLVPDTPEKFQFALQLNKQEYLQAGTNKWIAPYIAADPDTILAVYQEHERQPAPGTDNVISILSNTITSTANHVQKGWADNLLTIFVTLAVAGAASWFICYLTIRYEYLHAHLSHDQVDSGPQKFHSIPTSRIGGLGLFGGLITGSVMVSTLIPANILAGTSFVYLLLAAIPVFIGGLLEDCTKNVGVSQRLLLSMISATMGAWLLGAVIHRVDIPLMDSALNWLPFAIAFTVFAVGGVVNAINIIDGYNGLAGGFSVIALIAMALVAGQVDDSLILVVTVSMIGATLGFLLWNWPNGKIFMGDGGAYLLGFILAEFSVLLVYRNPSVSPWFPILLLAYPVLETLYSIYRRAILDNANPCKPDALHLHQFVFFKIEHGRFSGNDHQMITRNNSRVAPQLLFVVLLNALFAVLFWQTTFILMIAFFVECVLYILIYNRLIKLQGMRRLATRI